MTPYVLPIAGTIEEVLRAELEENALRHSDRIASGFRDDRLANHARWDALEDELLGGQRRVRWGVIRLSDDVKVFYPENPHATFRYGDLIIVKVAR